MAQTLDYKGKPMEFHVGNFRSHPTCMSLTGTVPGLFGMKRDVTMLASVGDKTGAGRAVQMYQGYLNASDRDYYDIKHVVESNGLAKPVLDAYGQPDTKRVGSYNFMLYQFDADKLRSLDPKGCARYEHNVKSAIVIQNTRDAVNARMNAAMNQDYQL